MTGFLGWKEGSLWAEIKFVLKHFADIDGSRWPGTISGRWRWLLFASRLHWRRFVTLMLPKPIMHSIGWKKGRGFGDVKGVFL
jgi:hypothetical protein